MTKRDSLALLIPAYNAAHYLPRLLDSAARQSEPFDEVLVYDDCSSDDTAATAQRYGVKVVRGSVNRGCSYGKNALAARTRAGWMHFHDADDELLPNFVALARRWMADARFDVVLFSYEERNDANGEHIGYRVFDPKDVARDARSYAIREQINPFCGLYRRKAFLDAGGYDEDPLVLYNEDVATHVQLAFAGLLFAAETEFAIINHRRPQSMSSSNQVKCYRAHYQAMRKLAAHPKSLPYAREIAARLWNTAACLTSELDWETADRAATLAMQLAGLSAIPSGPTFKTLCRISPKFALRTREGLIRILKPQYREGRPGWRAGRNAG